MRFEIWKKGYFEFLKKKNLGLFKRIFFLLSLLYFCIYFFSNIDQITFKINLENYRKNILLSFIFCILSIYLNAYAWKNIVRWFGIKKIKNNLVSFYVLTNVLKYVPGGIWHFVERFNFINDISNPELALYSTIVEPYFMLCASFLLSSIGVIFSPFYLLLTIPLIFLNRKLIYVVLKRLEFLKRKALNSLKYANSKYQLEERINLNSFFPTRAFIYEIGFILSKFVGFLICFLTVNSDRNTDYLFLFVIFCLSWTFGLIVPGAPGGVGVFEASFLLFVGKNISQNTIFTSLVYFRLISTSADLFLSFPFLLKKIFKKI
ncbi:MAG: hypothetical protein CMD04_00715 [Flavobacteriales bacterium]|nr:hypothetical protein [Flavobacteriales bacterium]